MSQTIEDDLRQVVETPQFKNMLRAASVVASIGKAPDKGCDVEYSGAPDRLLSFHIEGKVGPIVITLDLKRWKLDDVE